MPSNEIDYDYYAGHELEKLNFYSVTVCIHKEVGRRVSDETTGTTVDYQSFDKTERTSYSRSEANALLLKDILPDNLYNAVLAAWNYTEEDEEE